MKKKLKTSQTSSSKSISSNVLKATIDGQEFNFSSREEFNKFMGENSSQVASEEPAGSDEDEPSNTETEPSQLPQLATRKRKLISPVWKLFEKIKDKDIATCRLCGHTVSHKKGSGTGTLSRHFVKHPEFDKEGGDVSTQQHLQLSASGQVENWRYSHKRAREATVRFVVQKEKPFSFAEDPIFESYVQTALQPQWKRIPRTTLYNDGMRLFKEDCEILKAVFDSLTCKFSFTSDLWTGRCNLSYMCVTAHWVDDDWIMQKRIIDFVELPHPHTGQEIQSQMIRTLKHWDLKERSLSFSFDNASNNLSAVRLLSQSLNPILGGKLFHVGCICHIIHLCVKDGLTHILGSIEKIRSCLSHITSSSTRTQKYRELVQSTSKNYCYPYLDCKIRWNSTFRMLQECRPFANEIIEICSDFKVVVGDKEVDPTENYLKMNDFEVVDVLKPLLKKFKEVSEVMSGHLYPTSNLLLAYMVHITKIFDNLKHHALLGVVIKGMLGKWIKYFEKVPTIAILTACLDPRCKIDGCIALLKMYYKNIGLEGSFDDTVERANINSMFKTLYDAYDADTRPVIDATQSQSTNDEGEGIFGSLLGEAPIPTTPNTNASVNEVMYFFGGSKTADKPGFNVLHWWRDEARSSFPVLRRIAHDLLASQMSTVASESCFSAAGRTLTDKRSRLTPKSIRFCVMWKDMLDAESRTKFKLEEGDDEFDIFMRGHFDNLEDDFVPEEQN